MSKTNTLDIHLSLNGGLNLEDLLPTNLITKFTILRYPRIERVAISGGFSTKTSNYITIGRSETKSITLHGINMNSGLNKNAICLFESQF
jgi:hypothetical protein